MRLVATTVVRESTRGKQTTGHIYDIDWDSREVVDRHPVPEPSFPESDDNPRGGVRGGRGVVMTPKGLVMANYDTLYVFDDDWQVVDSLSHPLFVGIHEIDWDGEHLWAAATAIDAVLRVGLDWTVEAAWDPHGRAGFERFGLRPRPHPLDGTIDYRVRQAPVLNECHVNGVARWNGTTVINCGLVRRRKPLHQRLVRRTAQKLGISLGSDRHRSARSLVVRLDPDRRSHVLVELDEHDFPTHNGQLLDENRVAVNDSTDNTLRVFELGDADPREVVSVEIPGTWLRGLEPIAPTRVFVGSAPASVALVDLDAQTIEASLQLSDNPNEAVHGLTAIPS
jgi:hypothetical protein